MDELCNCCVIVFSRCCGEKVVCKAFGVVTEKRELKRGFQASGDCTLAWMALMPDKECKSPMALAMVSGSGIRHVMPISSSPCAGIMVNFSMVILLLAQVS